MTGYKSTEQAHVICIKETQQGVYTQHISKNERQEYSKSNVHKDK